MPGTIGWTIGDPIPRVERRPSGPNRAGKTRSAGFFFDVTLDGAGVAATFAEPIMNLRCVFHVSPASSAISTAPEPKRMPSVVDEVEAEPSTAPRGRSFETWTRARGWASED